MSKQVDRNSGDYNTFWHARNYLPNADKVQADVLIVHGLQDFNVTTSHAFNFWHALPKHAKKHAFLHQGGHIYINNWQSIDFSETMNAYFTAKLLDRDLKLDLPKIIWQKNKQYQTFETLNTFGTCHYQTFQLGESGDVTHFDNHYPTQIFETYSKDFNRFKTDLFNGKANATVLDIPITKTTQINGQIKLALNIKLNDTKGLLSAQVLDFGQQKRLQTHSTILDIKTIDRGRNFMLDNLCELTLADSPYQVISKGFLNLQNRKALTTISSITPDGWLYLELALQPTIYELKACDTLRLLIYSTDFEHTLRDNRKVTYTLNLGKSKLFLPI
jgi:X-Pro dipeptidyl-peptidase